jgi:5-methylcytosine-specific restriction endonuclease McrA
MARGIYKCAHCKEKFPPKQIAVDHIVAATPPEGLDDWDEYINRLFCPTSGLQVLCKACHKLKTLVENDERRIAKKKKRQNELD